MKLRIKDNSIRLRLSQTEVKGLDEHGEVQCAINFGPSALSYKLQKSGSQMVVDYSDNLITIAVPSDVVATWANTEQVGIDREITLNNGDSLSILLEKDFKCLTDRPGEDESDLYENPLDKHSC